jgi:hypothetical protein
MIEENHESELTIRYLAREAKLSPYHFFAKFSATDAPYSAPICAAHAAPQSSYAASDRAGKSVGYCAGLRIWGRIEFQSGVS